MQKYLKLKNNILRAGVMASNVRLPKCRTCGALTAYCKALNDDIVTRNPFLSIIQGRLTHV
jgi:hypothetical protein